MKKEIKLEQNNGKFDIAIENGDFANENGFDTAIWVSLFTDARASESQVILPENRRGWLGNLVSDNPERQLGGYLWLSEQRRLDQDTLNETVDFIRKSLSWFTEDGIAVSIDVSGEIIPLYGITISIYIKSLDGVTSKHFIDLWKLTGEE